MGVYGPAPGALTSRHYGARSATCGIMPGIRPTAKIGPGPLGTLLPNDLGLFDTLGNMSEWCQEAAANADQTTTESYEIINEIPRLLRGGSFTNPSAYVRSAYRIWYAPANRFVNCGFRPARTYD